MYEWGTLYFGITIIRRESVSRLLIRGTVHTRGIALSNRPQERGIFTKYNIRYDTEINYTMFHSQVEVVTVDSCSAMINKAVSQVSYLPMQML